MENYVDPTIDDPNAIQWRGTDGGTKLKATSGWYEDGNGSDIFSFSALPGGYRYWDIGTFFAESTNGTWWTSAESNANYAWYRGINYDVNQVHRYSNPKQFGFSVRCIKYHSADNLVAHYPFNGNANDEGDNGYNGTVYGAQLIPDRFGNANSAYSFDGADDYILVGDPVPENLLIQNEITLNAWIYLPGAPTNLGMIVGSQYDPTVSGASIFIDSRENADGQTNPSGHIHFQIGNGTWHVTNSSTVVPTNQWVMITATRKANEEGKIYYNDQLQPSQSMAWDGGITYDNTWFAIGKQKSYSGREFYGFIDDVRVYNRALSEAEVQALYSINNTLPNVTTSIVTNIGFTTATGGGNVNVSGGSDVTVRGVVWDINENPTVESNEGISSDGDGLGEYTSNITELEPQTTYYVRAYATNSAGTAYGQQENFTTLSTTEPQQPSGSGTSEDPYLVENLGNLLWVSQNESSWDNHFRQTADIDAAETTFWNGGEGWMPLGDETTNFSGLYNGSNYQITGLHINRPDSDYQGFIGLGSSFTVTGLRILDANITGGNSIGGIVGSMENGSVLTYCSFSGNVSGNGDIGGLAGYASYGGLSKCYSTGTVSGTAYNTGGLVGHTEQFGTDRSYSRSNVNGNISVGGLVGSNTSGSTVWDCFSTGSVNGVSQVGGLIGVNSAAVFSSYWDIETSGQDASSGGYARTTEEMTSPYDSDTYVDWDFNLVWGEDFDYELNDGYPYLREEELEVPSVSTYSVEYITSHTAKAGGEVTAENSAPVTDRGLIWGFDEGISLDWENYEGLVYCGYGLGSFTAIMQPLTPSTTYYYCAFAISEAGYGYGEVLSFTTPSAMNLCVALDNCDLVFETGGDSDWFGQSVTTQDGIDAAQSGYLGDNSYSEISTTVQGPGTLNFWWKTSSEDGDFLRFYVDGIQQAEICSETEWIYFEHEVYEGQHSLKWSFEKDEAGSDGEDCGWVDQVVYTPYGVNFPTVTTTAISNITETTATSGGNVTDIGDSDVSARGVVWSTSEAPTVTNNDGITLNGVGDGEFTSELTDLTPNTTYYVRAYATNNQGTGYGEELSFITLASAPEADFVADITTGVVPLTVHFTDLSIYDPTSWNWEFGDGSVSDEQNPTHIYTSVGTFTVSLTVTNEMGSDTETKVDYILVIPSEVLPTLTTLPVTNITQTSATSGGNITSDGGYYVFQRGVVWSTTQNPTTYNYEGITNNGDDIGEFVSELTSLTPNTKYYLRAYATNSEGTAYGNQQSFSTAFSVTFTVYSESGYPIQGASVALNGDTQTTGTNGITVFYLTNGDYEYTVSATGYLTTGGYIKVLDEDQNLKLMLIADTSTPPFIIGEDHVCRGSEVIYSISATLGGSWEAVGGNLLSNSTSHALIEWHSASENSRIRYRITNTSGYQITYELPVSVDTLNIVTTSHRPNIHVKGSIPILICTTQNLAYQWFMDNELLSGESKQFYVAYDKEGEFSVQVKYSNMCPFISNPVSIISNTAKDAQITVFPNPNEGNFIIKIQSTSIGKAKLVIIDAFGKVVHTETFAKNEEFSERNIFINSLPQGVYAIWVQIGNSLPLNTKLIIL